jgi:hypothetical protein
MLGDIAREGHSEVEVQSEADVCVPWLAMHVKADEFEDLGGWPRHRR